MCTRSQYLTAQLNSVYEVLSNAKVPSTDVLGYHNQQQDPAHEELGFHTLQRSTRTQTPTYSELGDSASHFAHK